MNEKKKLVDVCWEFLKKNKGFTLSVCGILLILLFVLVVPALSPYSYDIQNVADANQSPSISHPFGTDSLGRDMLVRIARGTGLSLLITLMSIVISGCIGTLYGATCGYLGGMADLLMYRLIEIMSSIPAILWVLFLSVLFKPGVFTTILIFSLTGWVMIAQVVRAKILGLSGNSFVKALEIIGAHPLRIVFLHLIPNCYNVIIVQLMLTIPMTIFAEATISYLGLGVSPPQVSLGILLNEGVKLVRTAPYLLICAGGVMFFVVFVFYMMGESLQKMVQLKE